jgi:integrase
MQIVEENLSNAVESPTLSSDDNSRDEYVSEDEAEIILDRLDRFDYASRDHIVITLLWATGLRTCSIRSLDLDDVDIDEELLELRHRPESGTTLKNQYASERLVAVKPTTATILNDYIEHTRVDQCDEFDRDPLITTQNGRVGSSVIRKHSYGLTRPCKQGLECPHDRDPDSCDAAQCKSDAYGCPSSKSPHTWRRGHITHLLENDVPPEVVSGRADVTPEVIEDHYDSRDERTRVEQRRGYLDNI